ncbi:hypothetical protein WJX72_003801 [[Myrmecia] bisecta]|uniref:MYND-type domain-containing protein n=1 Tax=[Myrmecia] bisecta TaxID=41462 RepID=A0AAW1QR56_9CHLO
MTLELSPKEISLQRGPLDDTGDRGTAEVVRAHLVKSKVQELTRTFNASWTPEKAALSQRTLEVLATDESQCPKLHEENAAEALAEFPRLLAQEAAGEVFGPHWSRNRWMYEWQALMQRGAPASYRFNASWTPEKAALSQRTLEVLATDESQCPKLHEENAAEALAEFPRLLAQEAAGEVFGPHWSRNRWMYEWQALMQRGAPASYRSMDARLPALMLLTRQASEQGIDLLPNPSSPMFGMIEQSCRTITESPEDWARKHLQEESRVFCQNCYEGEKPGEQFARCSQCKTTFYCSRECQKADWRDHKKRCQEFAARLAKTKAMG